ncbi:MAG: DUF3160 domain-containing protein [Verrucomicrobiales bacterium]|nr:DUF3160 domain-containing protein [Verrucomicrobiales bacterium]
MKSQFRYLLAAQIISALSVHAAEPARLTLHSGRDGLELAWPAVRRLADGTVERPWFELQRSADLRRWETSGERKRASSSALEEVLTEHVASSAATTFYRLLTVSTPRASKLASGGAEVFGYGEAFTTELERIGQISPEQFASMFPNEASYLPRLSWDVTTAQFWNEFNEDRFADYRLNSRELTTFNENGFVVSERLGANSFADVFYDLWHADLPVFISCDALLQAWHRTYDAMLEEIERTYLFNSVQAMLDGMASQLTTASPEIGEGVLRDSLLDADYFLTVARSLLAGEPIASVFGQSARVAETLARIREEQLNQVPDFMGFCRIVDFSQFKVRGHYTHSERLGRYFKCLMWLGRIDVPVAGGPWKRCPSAPARMTSPRETGLAIVLWRLLNLAGEFETWRDMERIIQTFVGPTDSLTFGQLGGLLAGTGIRSLADIRDLATVEKLQSDIVRGELGVQNIRSDWFEQPLEGAERYTLPQTFTVFGQKFVPDSWVLAQTVASSILWVENGTTNKVQRRVPGALDMAFAVLRNDQIVPELVDQMNGTFEDADRPHALHFRDGLPYQHNLAAVRSVMDRHTTTAWDSNLYMSWLDCLRQLSTPTTEAKYPEAMRTRAWAMKTLNTQLASWTHLRHDTILYAKQSYTDNFQCVYPTGYVEPRVEFWSRLQAMATRAAEQIAALTYLGEYLVVTNHPPQFDPVSGDQISSGWTETNSVPLAAIQSRQVNHLRNFAGTIARLETLARKELAAECFNAEDLQFIDGLMEKRQGGGCGQPWFYSGWYPELSYRTVYWPQDAEFHRNYGAGTFDAVVADVHTDVPNTTPPDPGSVLHEAVGRVNLLMLAVENGSDRFICAGPVLSHYEFEVIGAPRRISDSEWSGAGTRFGGGILNGAYPSDVPANRIEGLKPPPWTRSYLAPRP